MHSIDALLLISIHAPLRERRSSMPEDQKQALISIHAPLRERRLPQQELVACPISIHAPLRERRSSMPEDQKQALISIHAPLRERRLPVSTIICRPKISIHAPLRERLEAAKERIEEADFNPRSLTGATEASNHSMSFLPISIHAPLRERHDFLRCINYPLIFQSTLPYGSDQYLLPTSGRPLKFQSTLPYGSDRSR